MLAREAWRGIILMDLSGTWLKAHEGVALPKAEVYPTKGFVDRVHELAFNPRRPMTLEEYLKDVFQMHRRWPGVDSVLRSLGVDPWHVIDRKEIEVLDISKVKAGRYPDLNNYDVNHRETDDLKRIMDRYHIIVGSGILYSAHNSVLAKLGSGKDVIDSMILRGSDQQTGFEHKYAINCWMLANRNPGMLMINRDDDVATGVGLSGRSDRISLVHPTSRQELERQAELVPKWIEVNIDNITNRRPSEEVYTHEALAA